MALVVLLALAMSVGCALPRSTLPVVKIGLIAPFEGLGRPLGYEVLYAAKLAVQERNSDGSLDGYRVALVALNDDDVAEHAGRQALKMIVDGDVLGVIGPLSRATARAVAEPLEEAGLAWVAPASAPDDVIAGAETAFRLFASDSELAEAAVATALVESGQASVVVPEAGDFAGPLRAEAVRRGVLAAGLPPAEDGAAAVVLGGNAEQVAELLPQVKDTSGAIVAGPESGRMVVPQRAGAAADGLRWVSSVLRPDALGLSAGWLDGYRSLAGAPAGPNALMAYEATNLLLDAISDDIAIHGRPSRAGVLASMKHMQKEGLLGLVAFDDQGSWLDAPVVVYRMSGDDIFADAQFYEARR